MSLCYFQVSSFWRSIGGIDDVGLTEERLRARSLNTKNTCPVGAGRSE
jgi:hypothetical protein